MDWGNLGESIFTSSAHSRRRKPRSMTLSFQKSSRNDADMQSDSTKPSRVLLIRLLLPRVSPAWLTAVKESETQAILTGGQRGSIAGSGVV